MSSIIILAGFVFLFFIQVLIFLSRYKKCPPGKILVIYGKVSPDPEEHYLVITSGAAFVWPVIQDYSFLDTQLMEIQIHTTRQNLVNVNFSCKISKSKELAIKAAENFHKEELSYIIKLVEDSVTDKIEHSLKELSSSNLSSSERKNKIEETIKASLNDLGIELIRVKNYDIH